MNPRECNNYVLNMMDGWPMDQHPIFCLYFFKGKGGEDHVTKWEKELQVVGPGCSRMWVFLWKSSKSSDDTR
jgi:hypothetical protein